jgi:hypothetical protein
VTDAFRKQLILLLGAYGYNLYDDKNRARADDLLVRSQAAAALGEAANALRELRTEYRRRYVPPPTREQPDPPRDRLDQLGAMARLQDRLSDLETGIRSMAVPTQDRVWERFRREATLLEELLLYDYNLIAPCQEVRDQVLALTADMWRPEAASGLQQSANQIERAMRGRAVFLSASA